MLINNMNLNYCKLNNEFYPISDPPPWGLSPTATGSWRLNEYGMFSGELIGYEVYDTFTEALEATGDLT